MQKSIRQRSGKSSVDAHNDSALFVDTVNLEDIFGQIEADRANFHGGWLLA